MRTSELLISPHDSWSRKEIELTPTSLASESAGGQNYGDAATVVADLSGRHYPDHAGNCLRVPRREGDYIHGHLPVFQHAQQDLAAFRYFTSQLVVNGTVGQAAIARAFHVPTVTVKWCG